MTEFAVKLERIRNLLEKQSLDPLLLQGAGNFAWAACRAASRSVWPKCHPSRKEED
jgi:hypothetical protein